MTEEIEGIPHLLPPELRVGRAPDPYETRLFQVVEELGELRPGDVALLGIPFDGAKSVGRPGARFAPAAIREALLHRTTYRSPGNWMPCSRTMRPAVS